jgi:hypothetical protein
MILRGAPETKQNKYSKTQASRKDKERKREKRLDKN